MTTQGIFISSDSTVDLQYSRLRSVSGVTPSLTLPVHSIADQENRSRSTSSGTSKSPGKVLKPQVISPRLLISNPPKKNDRTSEGLKGLSESNGCMEGSIRSRTYTPATGDIRGSVSCNNVQFPNLGNGSTLISSGGSVGNNANFTKNGNIGNQSNMDSKPVLRSASNHTQSSQQKASIKRFITNPKSLKHENHFRASQSPTQFKQSPIIPAFPSPPAKPEKFSGGNNKLAYKKWMKERAKYEKWESAKTLYDTKLISGNIGDCHKIVQRLNSEIDELTKAIKEDECRMAFPEEPPKPAEYCPPNIKEAKAWYQQKILYEAWQNAFTLFQENSAKGDIAACKKLVDIIQMTLYNHKPELAHSQLTSSRRHAETSTTKSSIMDSELISKPGSVKFAPNPPVSLASPGSCPTLVPSLSKTTRPKMKPPASWTKPKTNDKTEKEKDIENHIPFTEGGNSLAASDISSSRQEVFKSTESVDGDLNDHLNLLKALDLELADLNTSLDNYFTQTNQNNE